MNAPHPTPADGIAAGGTLRRGLTGLFEYSRRALTLVWTTNRPLSIALAGLTLLAGVLPAGIAYVGALIVDAVIHAADLHRRTGATALSARVRAGRAARRCWSPPPRWRSAASRSRNRCCARSSASAST